MQLYQSTKQLHAEPKTLYAWKDWRAGDGNLLKCNRDMYKNDKDAEGYHIVYKKGTVNEYHSWCPKKDFEEGNVKIPRGMTRGMLRHDESPYLTHSEDIIEWSSIHEPNPAFTDKFRDGNLTSNPIDGGRGVRHIHGRPVRQEDWTDDNSDLSKCPDTVRAMELTDKLVQLSHLQKKLEGYIIVTNLQSAMSMPIDPERLSTVANSNKVGYELREAMDEMAIECGVNPDLLREGTPFAERLLTGTDLLIAEADVKIASTESKFVKDVFDKIDELSEEKVKPPQ